MARARKPKRPTPDGFHQMNTEIRKDIVLKAKTFCLYRGISLSQFVERAMLKALSTPQEPT